MSNVKELSINNVAYDIIGKGVVDQNNTTPLKQWSGTKAQYDAIATKDANTIYNITDDTNPNDYAHTNLDNVSAGIDYVIASQLPTSSNNYTFYRLYKSGWVEQGGMLDAGSDKTANSDYTVTLPVEMSNTDYYSSVCMGGNSSGGGYGAYTSINTKNKSTTSFNFYVFKTENSYRYVYWEVKGMSAQGGS